MKKIIEFLTIFIQGFISLFTMEFAMKKKNQSFSGWFNGLGRSLMMTPENFMGLSQLYRITPYQNRLRRMAGKNGGVAYFAMMSLPTVPQVIIATYDEKPHWGDRHAQMFGRLNACTANAQIPIPPATMILYQSRLADYLLKQTNMATGAHVNTELRDNAYRLSKNDILACMAVAQAQSNDFPLSGIAIIQSGLFGVKSVPLHDAHIFHAVSTGPGTMYIEAGGAGPHANHDWEWSSDGIN